MGSDTGRYTQLLLVGLGGAVGAVIRWAIADAWTIDVFPWPTLLVNVIGCSLLAAVSAHGVALSMKRLLGTGFCGGLTTFSTLSVEVVRLLDAGKAGTAAIYVVASVALGLAAYVAVRSACPQPPKLDHGEFAS